MLRPSYSIFVASLLCFLSLPSAFGATLYVAPDGDDSRTAELATHPATPLKTIGHALELARPGEDYGKGDTIVLRGGIYSGQIKLNKSGVTLRAYPGERPALVCPDAAVWEVVGVPVMDRWDEEKKQGIFSPVHHVQLIGLTIDGSQSSPECNGIAIHATAHHIRVLDCIVRNMGGAGIAAVGNVAEATREVKEGADYITLTRNAVYRCAWGSKFDQSGITLFGLANRGAEDRNYHNFIIGNRVYENQSRYTPPSQTGLKFHTDGNGIIVDTCFDGPRSLIANNLVYRNGGRGIHIFKSNNIDVVNNTCLRNLMDGDVRTSFPDGAGPSAELSVGQSARVRFFNNIAVSLGAPGTFCARSFDTSNATRPEPGSIRFEANLFYGGIVDLGAGAERAKSWRNQFGDPLFVNSDADVPDLRCRQRGPGVDAGSRRVLLKTDFGGENRIKGRAPDIGAWETSAR